MSKRSYTMLCEASEKGGIVKQNGLTMRSHVGTSAVTATLLNVKGKPAQIFIEWGLKDRSELITIIHDIIDWADKEFKGEGVVENAVGRFMVETGRGVETKDAAGLHIQLGRLTYKKGAKN